MSIEILQDGSTYGVQRSAINANFAQTMELVGSAYIGGDRSGNSRGDMCLDIQTTRALATQVAGGNRCLAIGVNNTASNYYSQAIGYENAASNIYCTAIGSLNTASGYYSTAIGYSNTVSGYYSAAFGYTCVAGSWYSVAIGSACYVPGTNGGYAVAMGRGVTISASGTYITALGNNINITGSGGYALAVGNNIGITGSGYYNTAIGSNINITGDNSQAFGNFVEVDVDNVFEAGLWNDAGARLAVIRSANSGIASSLRQSDTKISDGGATVGSELGTTLPRDMYTARINNAGTSLIFEVNVGGTVKTATLAIA